MEVYQGETVTVHIRWEADGVTEPEYGAVTLTQVTRPVPMWTEEEEIAEVRRELAESGMKSIRNAGLLMLYVKQQSEDRPEWRRDVGPLER